MNTQATLSMQQKHILRRAASKAGRYRTRALNIVLMRYLKKCTGSWYTGTDNELLLKLSKAAGMSTQDALDAAIERIQLGLDKTTRH